MNALMIMVPASLLMGVFFLGLFIWAVKKGQFDDLVTPQYEVLLEDKQIEDKIEDKIDEQEPTKSI